MKSFTGTINAFNQIMLSVRHSLAPKKPRSTRRSHAEYHTLIEHLHQVVFEIDSAGLWTFLNASWTNLTGFSVEESINTDYVNYIHPQDQDNCRKFLERLADQRDKPHSIVVRLLNRGGFVRWTEMHGDPIYEAPGGVVGILNDITDRVHEEGLLAANHRSLTSLINDLPAMIYRCRNNRDWTMEYVCRGSVELTGYSPEDIINSKALAYGSLIHSDDREQVWQKVQSALREEREFDLEYRIHTASGAEKWAWERGKGIFLASGELLGLEGFITDVTEKKRDEERLRENSLYDSFTGLRTPPLFMDHLQHAINCANAKPDSRFALLVIHIDGLRKALANLDSEAAHQAFQEISQRLRKILTPTDILTHLRDDRYLMLLTQVRDIRQVIGLTGLLRGQLLPPINVGNSQLYVTTSIGIAMSESHYQQRHDILRDAETALDRAKALGGGRHELFDLRSHARATAVSQMESELQQALERGDLSLYWQPTVSLRDGHFAGIDAHLAWPHPRRGLLFADQFIPMVEETQVIGPLWEWTLEEACRQMRAWQRLDQPQWTHPIGINIKVFGKTLLDSDVILRLGDNLLDSKPKSFELAFSVSEHALVRAPRAVKNIAKRLKSKDIRVILDDFGSADSSLALLKSVPVDLLRLDRSLFENADKDARFAAALVSFAHAVGVHVIADAVMTQEKLAAVRNLGCDYAQGDIVSPPLDAQALISAIESGKFGGQ